jgi:DNA replication protein DnaC
MNSFLANLASDRAKRREARIRQLQQERDAREQALFARFPRLTEIKATLAEISLDMARIALGLPARLQKDPGALRQLAGALQGERLRILAAAGISPRELEIHWDCSDCQNTGWLPAEQVDGDRVLPQQKCHCLQQEEIDDLYRISGLTQPMRRHTFDSFDRTVYPEAVRAEAEAVRAACEQFADAVIDGRETLNLLLMGDVGRGKTFLCTCVANRLLATRRTVVYLTFLEFLDLTRKVRFESAEEGEDALRLLLEADLLILDDLGAEKVSEFVLQELFRVINTRMNRGVPFVISTNLDAEELQATYTARIFSRLAGSCRVCQLEGDDIRGVLAVRRMSAG